MRSALHQADTKAKTSSSKFSGSCVLTSQTLSFTFTVLQLCCWAEVKGILTGRQWNVDYLRLVWI